MPAPRAGECARRRRFARAEVLPCGTRAGEGAGPPAHFHGPGCDAAHKDRLESPRYSSGARAPSPARRSYPAAPGPAGAPALRQAFMVRGGPRPAGASSEHVTPPLKHPASGAEDLSSRGLLRRVAPGTLPRARARVGRALRARGRLGERATQTPCPPRRTTSAAAAAAAGPPTGTASPPPPGPTSPSPPSRSTPARPRTASADPLAGSERRTPGGVLCFTWPATSPTAALSRTSMRR